MSVPARNHTLRHVQEAAAAREQTNGFKMDKSHTWSVCMFDDFDKLDRVPDEYAEAPPQDYKPLVRHFEIIKMRCICGRERYQPGGWQGVGHAELRRHLVSKVAGEHLWFGH